MNKRNVYIMYAVSFLTGMVFYASVSTLYRQAAGITVFQITIIESVSFLLSIFLEVPFGFLADHIGYRKTEIISMMLFALSKLIFFKADCFFLFLLERIVLSFSLAGLSGVEESIIYLSATKEKSQKVFGINSSLGTAGILTASAVYSLFLTSGYRLSALLTFITYSLAAVLTLFLKEVKGPSEEKKGITDSLKENFGVLKRTVSNRKLVFITLGFTFYGEAMGLMLNFLNQVKYREIGLSDRTIGIIYIAVTATGLLSFASDFVTKKAGKRIPAIISLLSGIVSIFMFALSGNAFVILGFMLVFKILAALTDPYLSQLYNDNITEEDRATAMSMLSVIADCAAVMLQLCIGKVSDFSITLGFLTGAASLCTGFTLFVLSGIFRKTKADVTLKD